MDYDKGDTLPRRGSEACWVMGGLRTVNYCEVVEGALSEMTDSRNTICGWCGLLYRW